MAGICLSVGRGPPPIPQGVIGLKERVYSSYFLGTGPMYPISEIADRTGFDMRVRGESCLSDISVGGRPSQGDLRSGLRYGKALPGKNPSRKGLSAVLRGTRGS